MKNSFISLVCAAALFFTLAYTGSVYAQNQNQTSASNAQNETMATITDKPQTTIANLTTIPAEQTTVTVNQTTNPIDQSQLQPIGNQTITSQTGNLSNLENKTLVQATGPATTTIANETIDTTAANETISPATSNIDQQDDSSIVNQVQPNSSFTLENQTAPPFFLDPLINPFKELFGIR